MFKNKKVYEAACIRSLGTPNPLPSFAKVVEDYAKANKGETLKREDIITGVAQAMGLAVDDSIASAVSKELTTLAKKNIVMPGRQHGYWAITR